MASFGEIFAGYAAWMLPPEAIEEFKILYHKRFGEQVSDQEAMVMAEKLLDLFRAVYRKNMQLV